MSVDECAILHADNSVLPLMSLAISSMSKEGPRRGYLRRTPTRGYLRREKFFLIGSR